MRPGQSGYALLVVLLMASLVLISLATAVPSILTQGLREREEELIFRGEQYQRAIGLYYKKFGRFPNKLEDLLETNERAFLRRLFPDPMTPEGEWRIIRVGPAGELIGSKQERVPIRPGGQSTSGSGGQTPIVRSGSPQPEGGLSGDSSVYPIAGVASRSSARSIRVYQGFEQYSLWEFVYDPVQEALQGGAANPPTESGTSKSSERKPSEPK